MLNISEELKSKFKRNSVQKRLIIRFPNREHADITNDQILSESMVMKELLCSQDELKFGLCNATKFEVTLAEVVANIKGCHICPVIAINSDEIKLGEYIVTDVEKDAGRPYKKVTAYNKMKLFDVDVKTWYGNLVFPMTLKVFRDALCSHIGIQQEAVTLINDDLVLERTLDSTQTINGIELMQSICEINGVFGNINREGKFRYVTLSTDFGLYPSETLYPSEDLYPSEGSGDIIDAVLKSLPIIEDFETSQINGVVIGDNDTYYETDSHINPYIIRDNALLYERKDLKQIAEKIANKINGIYYRPAEITAVGLPYLEVGDLVECSRKSDYVQTIILERTLKGIQSLTDVYKARGQEFFNKDYNSLTDKLKRLNRQYGNIKTTVESLVNGIGIYISEDGTVVTNLTLDNNGISFEGNKFVIDSGNIKIDKDGKLTCSDATITGGTIKINNIQGTERKYPLTISETDAYGNFTGLSDIGGGYARFTGGSSEDCYVDIQTVPTARTGMVHISGGLNVSTMIGPNRLHIGTISSDPNIKNSYVTNEYILTQGYITAHEGMTMGIGGTQIMSITAGSTVVNVSGTKTSVELISSGVDANKDIILICNGDGAATGVHYEGVTIQGGKAYATFSGGITNVNVRINWIRFTMA